MKAPTTGRLPAANASVTPYRQPGPSARLTPAKLRRLVPPLLAWYLRAARDLPWRHTRDPYAIWISEIMLQQTQVATVIPYWTRWMKELPTVEALAHADPDRILHLWAGLGYYRRARHAHAAARLLADRTRNRLPSTAAEWLELPGIGPYTAGAIASIAFNHPAPILDGNIIRVLTRWLGLAGDPRKEPLKSDLWALARQLVLHAEGLAATFPRPCSHLNQALMELGAMICSPRQPACNACPVAFQCRAFHLGHPERFPSSPSRPATTQRTFVSFILRRQNGVLVRQRPLTAVNGGFWELPSLEVTAALQPGESPEAASRRLLGLPGAAVLEPLGTVRHSITRYRLHDHAFQCLGAAGILRQVASILGRRTGQDSANSSDRRPLRWVELSTLDQRPFTTAHRRLLARLLDRPRAAREAGATNSADDERGRPVSRSPEAQGFAGPRRHSRRG